MRVVIAREPGIVREQLRQVVLGLGLQCSGADCVEPTSLSARLLEAPADLILVGVRSDDIRGLAAIRQAAGQVGAPVFAVGPSTDADMILQALRAGAREYLHEETVYDELLAALGKLHKTSPSALRWGQLLAVTGAKPGTGVTTVACNLADGLATLQPTRVALAELAAGVPELALDLDLKPPHSLAELLGARDRLDATLLRQAVVVHAGRLSVLAHQPDALQPAAPDAAAMRQILVLLQTMFEHTIIDLGHQLDPARLTALHMAHRVVLVINLDVPSLRLSRLLLRHLQEVGVPAARFHVVANRYGQRRQFPWKRAQEALGMTIQEWIPDDSARVNEALNHGQSLLQSYRGTGIARRFERLAKLLIGPVARPQGLAG
jgi:pilus assembly protein CpaE